MEFTADQIKKLPQEARTKAFRMQDQLSADMGARRQADRRRSELFADISDIDAARAKHIERNGGRAPSAEAESQFDDRKRDLSEGIKRFAETIPTLDERLEIGAFHIQQAAEMIDKARKIVPVKPPKSPRSVEAIRRDLDRLEAERCAIWAAPSPRAEQLAHAEAIISAEAARGRVEYDGRIRGRDPFNLRKVLQEDGSATGTGAGVFLLWLLREEVLSALSRMMPDDGPDTMTDEARSFALSKNHAEILLIEREEEAAIELADAEGRRINRRIDANPLAILGISIEA